jgi:hypothetical protein
MLNRNHIAMDVLPSCIECSSFEEAPRIAFEVADRFIAEAEKTGPKILIEWQGEIWKIASIQDTEICLSHWQANGFEFAYITLEQFFNAFGKALRGGK